MLVRLTDAENFEQDDPLDIEADEVILIRVNRTDPNIGTGLTLRSGAAVFVKEPFRKVSALIANARSTK